MVHAKGVSSDKPSLSRDEKKAFPNPGNNSSPPGKWTLLDWTIVEGDSTTTEQLLARKKSNYKVSFDALNLNQNFTADTRIPSRLTYSKG